MQNTLGNSSNTVNKNKNLHPSRGDSYAAERFRQDFINGGGIESLANFHPIGTDSFWGKAILEIVRDGKNISSVMARRNSLHSLSSTNGQGS
jgi:hypothetical protein